MVNFSTEKLLIFHVKWTHTVKGLFGFGTCELELSPHSSLQDHLLLPSLMTGESVTLDWLLFEPEALGNLVEGMDFHKFYFDNRKLLISVELAHFKSDLNPLYSNLRAQAACLLKDK